MRQTELLVALSLTLVIRMSNVESARAQDSDEGVGWSDTAELTLVLTGGNAKASTLGFRNELTHTEKNSLLTFEVEALRTESSIFTRTAVGLSPVNFEITKDSVTTVTAENYHTRGLYERELSALTFWYGTAKWERNTFAGIRNRYSFAGGIGNTWVAADRSTFKTAYGVSYTRQDDVVIAKGDHNSFAGLQASYDYRRSVTEDTTFTSALVADENLDTLRDIRLDLINAVVISMSSRLALKVSWRLLYDHQPSLVRLPLIGIHGLPTGDTVFTELETVDNLLTFALVADF